jgi:ATP-dependent Clp protease protease subunit
MKPEFNGSAKSPSNVLVPSIRDKDGTGYDIFSLLLKERIILVSGQVESNMTANIVAQIKYLEYQDPSAPITMLINSPGGSVIDGLAIVDIMRESRCRIITVGNGMQASMGSILLAAGDERKMTKNGQLLVHQIMGGAAGGTQHTDFELNAAHMGKLHEDLKSVYVEFTGLNHKYWDLVGERDTWFTAEQALKIGYITGIVKNEKDGGAYAAEARRSPEDQNAFMRAAHAEIAKMDAQKIVSVLNNGQANQAEWGRFRPELLVRLAEFPEYWTEKRRQEYAAKQAQDTVANDDAASRARKVKGPASPAA